MAFETRPGSGAMFENRKRASDKAPAMRGDIVTPDGQEWSIAGWWKEGRNGEFLSLKVEAPRERQEPSRESVGHRGSSRSVPGRDVADRDDAFADDVPF